MERFWHYQYLQINLIIKSWGWNIVGQILWNTLWKAFKNKPNGYGKHMCLLGQRIMRWLGEVGGMGAKKAIYNAYRQLIPLVISKEDGKKLIAP